LILDELMPVYDVKASYCVRIAAGPQRVWEELMRADFADMPIARRLMALRTMGRRKAPPGTPRTLATMGAAGAGGFLEIGRVPEEEIVLAVIGKFWRPSAPVLRGWKAEEFSAIVPDGLAKAAWNFHLRAEGNGTRLSTETRVLCQGRAARMQFRAYWFFIGFFSGWIRKEILQMVKQNCERA
jgi:hypothetical protein